MKYVVLGFLGASSITFLACFAISTVIGIIKYKRGAKKHDEEKDNQ